MRKWAGVCAVVAVASGVFAGGGAVAAMISGVGVSPISGAESEQAVRVIKRTRMKTRVIFCTKGPSLPGSGATSIISL